MAVHGTNSRLLDPVDYVMKVDVSQFMAAQDSVDFRVHFVLVLVQPSIWQVFLFGLTKNEKKMSNRKMSKMIMEKA
jgi:hypothetical protein